MEPNSLATIIHGKTSRIKQVLIYAALEWTLISFLLLNSLFSYLIIKFARYFRLKPPCLLCSRIDHIFEPHNSEPSYRNLICEQHSVELSKSGYCFSHRKLVESQEMCAHCSSSYQDLGSDADQFMCSCCGVTIRSKIGPTHFVIEPDLGILGDTQKGNLVSTDGYVGFRSHLKGGEGNADQGFLFSMYEADGENAAIRDAYENETILPQHLDFYIDSDDYGLIPVELLNLEQGKGSQVWRETDDELVFEPDMAVLPPGLVDGTQNLNSSSCLDSLKSDEPITEAVPNKEDMELEVDGVVRSDETNCTMKSDEAKFQDLMIEEEMEEKVDSDVEVGGREVDILTILQGQEEETKREIYLEAASDQELCVSVINSDDHVKEVMEMNGVDVEIPSRDFDIVVCHKEREVREPPTSCKEESLSDILENGHHGKGSKTNNTAEEGKTDKENELNEVEEDRISDTPTSIDSFQLLHRKLLLLGRSKPVNEEYGKMANEEYGDEEITFEELKLELKSERKAFRVLYEELEEERNAAAVAASQTMAMISRLQEEKAAIEMEALQYQRMMEEQAEYDHEALQLLNEILAKREKEKEELEMELEMCMKKLMDYEERENINHGKDGNFSVSCSDKEKVNGLPIVLNNEAKENGHHYPGDAMLNLKNSLSCFEEERISILEQLKVLEENLCTLAEEEENQIRNVNPFEEFYQENAQDLSRGTFKLNGDANGEHHQEKTMKDSEMKQFFYEDGGRLDPFLLDELPLAEFGSEKRRFTIEEEVERLYERLQALEEDKEFIKHCFGSLRKGDRGIDLLQEILQHLRELKSAEFRGKNADGVC